MCLSSWSTPCAGRLRFTCQRTGKRNKRESTALCVKIAQQNERVWGGVLLSPFKFFSWKTWRGMCLYPDPSLSSRSSRHGHVNSVSSVRIEEALEGEALNCPSASPVGPGTPVQLHTSLTCLSCLLTGSLNLIQGWALTILSSLWLKTRLSLVTSSPLATITFP